MSERSELRFIGTVESLGKLSRVKIFPEFCVGLEGLNNFSHIAILYWFHLRDNEEERHTLRVVPRGTLERRRLGCLLLEAQADQIQSDSVS